MALTNEAIIWITGISTAIVTAIVTIEICAHYWSKKIKKLSMIIAEQELEIETNKTKYAVESLITSEKLQQMREEIQSSNWNKLFADDSTWKVEQDLAENNKYQYDYEEPHPSDIS